MELRFTKMEGLGNDFIMLDDRDEHILAHISYSDLAVRLCDRHFGIGGDGVILARQSLSHDIRYVIINSDGTEPEMCGNGMRCFAKYLYEKKILDQTRMEVETLAGTVVPELILDRDQQVDAVQVDMGQPILACRDIPFVCDSDRAREVPLDTRLGTIDVTCVSMGNPHAVIFVDDLDRVDIEKWGRAVETHERFPEKTNVEFIQTISEQELKMRVWERGAGITLACGTGACASLVAARLTGRTGNRARIRLDGGDLDLFWDPDTDHIFKTGPARTVFEGIVRV